MKRNEGFFMFSQTLRLVKKGEKIVFKGNKMFGIT